MKCCQCPDDAVELAPPIPGEVPQVLCRDHAVVAARMRAMRTPLGKFLTGLRVPCPVCADSRFGPECGECGGEGWVGGFRLIRWLQHSGAVFQPTVAEWLGRAVFNGIGKLEADATAPFLRRAS